MMREVFAGGLSDGVVALRRPRPDDLGDIARYIDADDAQAWLSGVGDPAALLAEFSAAWANPPQPNRFGLTLVIADAADDCFVGVVHVDFDLGAVFVSYGVAPERRGRGFASRALLLVCEQTFGAGFERVELEIGDDNVASQGAARRAGFQPSIKRRSQVTEGGHVWHATTWVKPLGTSP